MFWDSTENRKQQRQPEQQVAKTEKEQKKHNNLWSFWSWTREGKKLLRAVLPRGKRRTFRASGCFWSWWREVFSRTLLCQRSCGWVWSRVGRRRELLRKWTRWPGFNDPIHRGHGHGRQGWEAWKGHIWCPRTPLFLGLWNTLSSPYDGQCHIWNPWSFFWKILHTLGLRTNMYLSLSSPDDTWYHQWSMAWFWDYYINVQSMPFLSSI